MTPYFPQPAPAPDVSPCFDKWALFDALRDARAAFGLKDRSLTVLRALLSFHPARSLSLDAPAIVFPSNATLANRCDGMPESTLRRHLAHLTAAGLITRHDSPSRKRYAHRVALGQLDAYGFDLSPLAARASEIAGHAATARDARATLAALRDRLRLLLAAATPALQDQFTRLLRRKDAAAEIAAAIETLQSPQQLPPPPPTQTPISSASNSHFGRHNTESNSPNDSYKPSVPPAAPDDCLEDIAACDVIALNPAIADYSHVPLSNWQTLLAFAPRLAAMLGLHEGLYDRMRAIMGPINATITLSFILKRFEKLSSAPAYANALCTKYAKGSFNPRHLLGQS